MLLRIVFCCCLWFLGLFVDAVSYHASTNTTCVNKHHRLYKPHTPNQQLSEAFKDQWAKFTSSSNAEASAAWDAIVEGDNDTKAADRVQRVAQYLIEKGVMASSGPAFYFNGQLQRRHGDWQTSLIVPALYEMQYLQVRTHGLTTCPTHGQHTVKPDNCCRMSVFYM